MSVIVVLLPPVVDPLLPTTVETAEFFFLTAAASSPSPVRLCLFSPKYTTVLLLSSLSLAASIEMRGAFSARALRKLEPVVFLVLVKFFLLLAAPDLALFGGGDEGRGGIGGGEVIPGRGFQDEAAVKKIPRRKIVRAAGYRKKYLGH